MLRKILATVAAAAVFATTFSPVDASAQRYGYHDRDRRDHDRGRRHHYRDRDNGDAVAAGVVGLIVGVAIGSLASQSRDQRVQCRDNYQRCPQPYYGDRGQSSYDRRGDDPRYDSGGSAYESDYGGDAGQGDYDDRPCIRREERWDSRANRYVTVDTPC